MAAAPTQTAVTIKTITIIAKVFRRDCVVPLLVVPLLVGPLLDGDVTETETGGVLIRICNLQASVGSFGRSYKFNSGVGKDVVHPLCPRTPPRPQSVNAACSLHPTKWRVYSN